MDEISNKNIISKKRRKRYRCMYDEKRMYDKTLSGCWNDDIYHRRKFSHLGDDDWDDSYSSFAPAASSDPIIKRIKSKANTGETGSAASVAVASAPGPDTLDSSPFYDIWVLLLLRVGYFGFWRFLNDISVLLLLRVQMLDWPEL